MGWKEVWLDRRLNAARAAFRPVKWLPSTTLCDSMTSSAEVLSVSSGVGGV